MERANKTWRLSFGPEIRRPASRGITSGSGEPYRRFQLHGKVLFVTKHVIEFEEDPVTDRTSWECDCGHGGSAPSHRADLAMEKHVNEGEPVSYRYQAK